MDEQSVKENIKRVRKELKLTQLEMAERVGLSRNAYISLESGPTRILNDAVEKVAVIADMPLNELVTGYPAPAELKAELDRLRTDSARRIAELEALLAAREREIATLGDHIESLKDTLRTKDEIISLLKKKSVTSQHDA
jgi:transcriptional regulator with XRE-family HTH domain